MTRVVVVGHVEWVQFVRVPRYPDRGGIEQGHAERTGAGGGAIVAAVVLARLGAEVELFTALGDDERADAAVSELAAHGITVHAARRRAPTRFAFTILEGGERTIVTVGDRLQPSGADELDWGRVRSADGVYFTAGDDRALERARLAPVLVVTPRVGDRKRRPDGGPKADATVFSATDSAETAWADGWRGHSRLMVATEGADGGRWWGESEGRWDAVDPPGPVRDSYGCGDAFAAGVTFGLAAGNGIERAAAIGAHCGADMLSRVGGP